MKAKSMRRAGMKPLETGQVWRMDGMHLQVRMVGKLLVHYKLAKPDAVRVSDSVSSRETVEKFLKKNRAVLLRRQIKGSFLFGGEARHGRPLRRIKRGVASNGRKRTQK